MIGYWGEVCHSKKLDERVQQLRVKLFSTSQDVVALHYIYGDQMVDAGDHVLVNTSALDLELGTGGYAFVMAVDKLHRSRAGDKNRCTYQGRVMKLRYTGQQVPVETVESEESVHHHLFTQPFSLKQRCIVMGELHSMLPIFTALIFRWQPHRTVAYLMDDQATLHLGVSEQVRRLKRKGNLITITYGQAVGGDLEAVNLFTALEAAVKVVNADDIVITQGPGVIGTRTVRGFSGMQLVHWLHTVSTCHGVPLVIPRLRWSDPRKRHFGLSEHTSYPLAQHALTGAIIPFPVKKESDEREVLLCDQFKVLQPKHRLIPVDVSLFEEELRDALKWYGEIKTMGYSYEDDPIFFEGVGASFYYYRKRLKIS